MVPKVHAKGSSFAGVAKYVLHDKDKATTDDRVAWVETRNLATDNGHVAWRVMAATAMDQDQLKEAAGVKKTGRKSSAHVLHYTLSWHADEAEGLTRDEMLRAVDASLEVLGRAPTDDRDGQLASEHQALIVCHDDEPQPHVHVIVNRVHPEHGVMLPSSNDHLKLSRWAQAYEEERGKVLCEQRVKNNAARDNGQYVKGEQDKPRHIHELEQEHKDCPDRDRIVAEQRAKDLALLKRERETKKQHKAAWKELRKGYTATRDRLKAQGERDIAKARETARRDVAPKWRELYQKHRQELTAFGEREKRFLGRIQNALAAVDWRAMLRSETRGDAIRGVFAALASRGVRADKLEKSHLRQNRQLEQRERGAITRAVAAAKRVTKEKLGQQRRQYLKDREKLTAQQGQELAEIKRAWAERRQNRIKAWKEQAAERDFNAAARNTDPRRGRTEKRPIERDADPRKRRQPRGRDRGPDDGRSR